jgi:hypothetical protein
MATTPACNKCGRHYPCIPEDQRKLCLLQQRIGSRILTLQAVPRRARVRLLSNLRGLVWLVGL